MVAKNDIQKIGVGYICRYRTNTPTLPLIFFFLIVVAPSPVTYYWELSSLSLFIPPHTLFITPYTLHAKKRKLSSLLGFFVWLSVGYDLY